MQMLYSKSILIFLFIGSIQSAFYYSLKRTNGNICQSIMFSIYFLSIKLNLIGHNPTKILDQSQYQSDQEICRILPYYTSDYSNNGRSKINMGKMEPYVRYRSQSVIKEIRGGGRVKDAAFLLGMLYMLKYHTVGFQQVRPVVRPPHVESAHNLLFGKPKSDGQSRLHLSNSNEISTNVLPTQIQAVTFVKKDGSIDLQQAFDEVKRRASVIGCENFDCSFERFEGLATECGETDTGSTREAITILEGEMRGYFRNARRGDYGPNVTGLDFVVEGLGEFDHITHVEVKGAVSSSIRPKPTLVKQAKKSVDRINYQKKFWSNKTAVKEKIPHINPDADLPKSSNNVLAIHDLWDVGIPEKSIVRQAIRALSKNDTNIVFLNDFTNT
nr:hypothetical protein [Cylindrotheca closterium]